MNIPFAKLSGSGNSFVLIDNRNGIVQTALAACGLSLDAFVIRICAPHGVGADGLILIEGAEQFDFSWRFFNADGSHADMCGNGARCAARFAQLTGISGATPRFVTGAGIIHAEIDGPRVKVDLTPPGPVTHDILLALNGHRFTGHHINTGVPHLVIPVPDASAVDVEKLGAQARYDPRFAPAGTNVNFVTRTPEGALRVRTYERGVERETMACGTGATACALVMASLNLATSPVSAIPLSGETLTVHFQKEGERFHSIRLEGPVRLMFRGEIPAEALL